jgi:hypothetical protein
MQTRNVVGVILLFAMLWSCATIMPVRSEFDTQADFSNYSSYKWVSDDPMIVPEGRSPEISALTMMRVVAAIESELERKGYSKAAAGATADFSIAFTVGTRERIDFDSYPQAYRGRWFWRPSYWDYEISARTYQEGMLGIDIFDETTRRPVWHGFTYQRITEDLREDPEPAIREAVAAVLEKFPP